MPKRDLFVSTFSPRLGNGRELRTFTVLRALQANGPLDILYVAHGGPPAPEFREADGLELHEVVPSRGAVRALVALGMRARGWPLAVARSCSAEVRAAAERLASAPDRGRVIVGDLNAMAMLMPLARRRPIIYNAHNVESSYGVNPYVSRQRWLPLEVLERRVLETAAESWMVSRLDVERARELAPRARLRYVPNVVDVAAIEPVSEPAPEPVVLMLADYTYPPNALSAHWLLEQIMPAVWERHPDAIVRFTGRGLELASDDPRVEVTGFAPSLDDVYAGARVVAVPLVEGAGTPLKFIEAMAYGIPVVATPLAAQGLEALPGVHYREGGTAERFAGQLVDLLSEPDLEMVAAGRRLAECEYSVQTLQRLVSPDPREAVISEPDPVIGAPRPAAGGEGLPVLPHDRQPRSIG